MSAHELPKLLTARRKAQRALADAEYALDAARKAHKEAIAKHSAAERQLTYASNAYDEARAEVNDIAGSGA